MKPLGHEIITPFVKLRAQGPVFFTKPRSLLQAPCSKLLAPRSLLFRAHARYRGQMWPKTDKNGQKWTNANLESP